MELIMDIDDSYKCNLWNKRNSVDNNFYVKNLLNLFDIKECKEIINNNNGTDLLINYGLKCYRICVDVEKMALVLLERNCVRIAKKGKDYYHLVKNAGDNGCFYGEDCWYNILKWIKGRNK